MTTPLVQGGRPLARFQVFGFPVHIDITFVLIVGILGYYPGVSLAGIAVWLGIASVAILIHELGHAFLARAAGAAPSIALAGLGGVTTYVPPRPLSRARQVGISLAGPLTGLVLGGAVIAYGRAVGVEAGTLAEDAFNAALITTLGWGVLNLLPILPLDGGQVLQELLPGPPAVRMRRAAAVSVVAGVLAALFAWYYGQPFAALLAVFFVVSNALTLRQPGHGGAIREESDPQTAVLNALWAGELAEAQAIADSPEAQGLDPAVLAAVAGLTGRGGQGRARLADLAAARPDDRLVAGLVVLTDALSHDWAAVQASLTGLGRGKVPPQIVVRAQEEAFRCGAHAESARIGESFLDLGGECRAQLAYNAACGWAQAGDGRRGVAAFRQAAELGFADLRQVDTDPDLEPLRRDPHYFPIRDMIRQSALRKAQDQS